MRHRPDDGTWFALCRKSRLHPAPPVVDKSAEAADDNGRGHPVAVLVIACVLALPAIFGLDLGDVSGLASDATKTAIVDHPAEAVDEARPWG